MVWQSCLRHHGSSSWCATFDNEPLCLNGTANASVAVGADENENADVDVSTSVPADPSSPTSDTETSTMRSADHDVGDDVDVPLTKARGPAVDFECLALELWAFTENVDL